MHNVTKGNWKPVYVSGVCIGIEAETEIEGYTQIICNTVLPDSDIAYKHEKDEIIANMTIMAESKNLLQALEAITAQFKTVVPKYSRDEAVIKMAEEAINNAKVIK